MKFPSGYLWVLFRLCCLTAAYVSDIVDSLTLHCSFDVKLNCSCQWQPGIGPRHSCPCLVPWTKSHDPWDLRPIRITRKYGPYIHPYIRAVFTARTYGCIFDTRIHGPCIRLGQNSNSIRLVCTELRAVFTARIHGCIFSYGPYVRVVRVGL